MLILIYSVVLDAVLVAKVIGTGPDFLEELRRKNDFFLYFSGIFLAPLLEELIFRGPIVLAIKEKAKPQTLWVVGIISTLIFAYLHGGIAEFAFAYGVLLALIAYLTKALYLPIIVHSLSNLLTLVLPHAWLFELNQTLIPVAGQEWNLLLHYVTLALVTICYAVLIVYFKRNLAEMSKVLAAKIGNKKS
jgi:membrane protease YdiL (CAAX protease family)